MAHRLAVLSGLEQPPDGRTEGRARTGRADGDGGPTTGGTDTMIETTTR